jgi:zinc/manganese transport system permease protein
LLFGNILGIDEATRQWVLISSTITCIFVGLFHYPLIVSCFDKEFFCLSFSYPKILHMAFYSVLIVNLISSYQAVGSLLSFGLMMLPAITARLSCHRVVGMIGSSMLWSTMCTWVGLSCSYRYNFPAGPTIILLMGGVYIGVYFFKVFGQYWGKNQPSPHRH